MHSYFIWDNVNSLTMGIYLDGPAPVIRGKERMTEAVVLGRAGTLLLSQGEDNFEPYTQQLILRSPAPVGSVFRWLRGDGYVTFSCEPDRKQAARVINQVQFKKVSRHLNWYEGTVAFYCQPFKRLIHEPEYAIVSGATVWNLGDIRERPVITLTGAYGDFTVGFGDSLLTVEGLNQSYGGCVVDSGAQALLSLDGQTLLTNLTGGEFPTIPAGEGPAFILNGSHTGAATIGRRQRWL